MRITVRYDRGSSSWQVPFKENAVKINEVSKTLCLFNELEEKDDSEITVVVSTSSSHRISYQLIMNEVDILTSVNTEVKVRNVPVGSPVFHYVEPSLHGKKSRAKTI